MMQRVPFLVGPTASGKTAVALHVAKALRAEILSADSRQLFRGMRIGTAQPTAEELSRATHHFVNCLDPEQTFSAGEYGRQARAKIVELLEAGTLPLVVGGSGLYVSALADAFFSGPAADPETRARLRARAKLEGTETLYRELQSADPEASSKIAPTDYRRIERALEIFYLTGTPISQLRRRQANPPPYSPIIVGLQWPRPQLYARINARCLQMLEQGLIDEVKNLLEARGLDPKICNALHSVGYAEAIQHLRGQIDYGEMVRLFQRNTRRFAKRQISWFGRDPRIRWLPVDQELDVQKIAQRALAEFAA